MSHNEMPATVQKLPDKNSQKRQLAEIWRGKVVIEEDFDELTEELENAFQGESPCGGLTHALVAYN